MDKFPDCSDKPLHPKWEGAVALAHRRYGAYPIYHDDEQVLFQFYPTVRREIDNEMNSFLMLVGHHKHIVYRNQYRVLLKED